MMPYLLGFGIVFEQSAGMRVSVLVHLQLEVDLGQVAQDDLELLVEAEPPARVKSNLILLQGLAVVARLPEPPPLLVQDLDDLLRASGQVIQ